MTDPASPPPDRLECPAATEPVVRLFILAGLLTVVGVWCFLDRHNYPAPPEWTGQYLSEAVGHVVNHYGPLLLVPLAAALGVRGGRAKRRVLVADAAGIGYAGGASTPWSEITALDAADLKDKQVLRLNRSRGKPLTLDAWKLRNFRALVAFIERKAPAPGKSRK